MSRFPSLPTGSQLFNVFRRFPLGVRPLLEYHDLRLRGPSPLWVGQRELIAAYVAALRHDPDGAAEWQACSERAVR